MIVPAAITETINKLVRMIGDMKNKFAIVLERLVSSLPMSLVNLVVIWPIGVVSKKLRRLRKMALASCAWKDRAAGRMQQ